ncbi:DEAD/DEAH box helicase [Paralysiella testudinis]|uniref:DEAD/DEAH box helicase n=1 Tax=Paralysiella testudinis TaxID=2809020 RepID=A0A892ZDG0_9NEIS|nr:DEAD/DEAH box helicase [Paralysiella testudinis]QRQ80670.1 DEAD/DEAH box helicase [Paralysiella testudinis]
MNTFTPRPYQHQIIRHIYQTPRCAIWAGMGMGKTSATLTALDGLALTAEGPALVLAPLRVAASTWPDEVQKWAHLQDLPVQAVTGSAKQRTAALQREAAIYTTNYENIPWLVEHHGDKWPFATIVADESTKLKSYRSRQGGSRARALAKVAPHSRRFIELTGTPSPNGLQDLWGQIYFLDKGARLGRSYSAFLSRWFRPVRVGNTPQAVRYEPLPHAQQEIQQRLADLCLTLDAADWFDIAAPIQTTIAVELPAKARQLYRQMEKEMFMQLSGSEIEAANAAAKTIKCLQIANGAAYTDEAGNWSEVHDQKLQALQSIVNEAGGAPVLVAYHFKSDLARLQAAFKQGRVLDQNPQTIRDWNAGNIPILFAHPASAGHGLNLQDGGNILVFFSHWWDLEQYQQIIERIGPTRQAQAGHKRPVFIYHIIAADTIDETVMARRDSKRSVQDLLLEAMKRTC